MLPFQSLNAVTATGAGTSHDLEGLARNITLAVTDTGGPSGSLTVDLQGSLDGTNWFSLGNVAWSGTDAAGTRAKTTGPQPSTTFNETSAYQHLVRYVRANVTALSGPRVATAWISAELVGEED